MIKGKNKLSYYWILLWVISNIVVGFCSLYLGSFLMSCAAFIGFPVLHMFLLSICYDSNRSLFWLLQPFLWFFSIVFLDFLSLFSVVAINILASELLLFLVSKKFGRFVFTTISFLGLGVIYISTESYSFMQLSGNWKLFILLFVFSLFTGIALELHRWNLKNIESEKINL